MLVTHQWWHWDVGDKVYILVTSILFMSSKFACSYLFTTASGFNFSYCLMLDIVAWISFESAALNLYRFIPCQSCTPATDKPAPLLSPMKVTLVGDSLTMVVFNGLWSERLVHTVNVGTKRSGFDSLFPSNTPHIIVTIIIAPKEVSMSHNLLLGVQSTWW